MNNKALTPEVTVLVTAAKSANGEFNINSLIEPVKRIGFHFDIKAETDRAVARFINAIIANKFRDEDGDRTILATGRTGEFIDRELCKNRVKLKATFDALELKIKGLTNTQRKVKQQIDGQMSLYDQTIPDEHIALGRAGQTGGTECQKNTYA